MAILQINKTYAIGEVLRESDLDEIKSGVENLINVTKLNSDNIQNEGIASDSIVANAVTEAKVIDATVTVGSLAAATLALLTPTGGVIYWTQSSPPTGFLKCDGSEKLIADYSALYSKLGTIHGQTTDGLGNSGSTHFRLPDYRGIFTRGYVGVYTDSVTVSSTDHTITVPAAWGTLRTGFRVQFRSLNELPAGSDYFIVQDTATTIKVASTHALALAGTTLTFGTDASGTILQAMDPDAGTRTAQYTGGNSDYHLGAGQSDAIQNHSHTLSYRTVDDGSGTFRLYVDTSSTAGATTLSSFENSTTDAILAAETRPQNMTLYRIIKT